MHDVDATTRAHRSSSSFAFHLLIEHPTRIVASASMTNGAIGRFVEGGERDRHRFVVRIRAQPVGELERRVRVTDEVVRLGCAPSFSSLRAGFLRALRRVATSLEAPSNDPKRPRRDVVIRTPVVSSDGAIQGPLYEIRGALLTDEEQILATARHLNTVNLPHEREGVQQILEQSVKSMTGEIQDPKRRQYVFVLVDRSKNQIIGTSMVFGQLGRKDAPYIYLDVIDEERYSQTLDKHFKHTTLNIAYSYDGPTEIGGLVLHPDYRRVPERLGTFLSYVRFLFIKMHRSWFQDEVLAELLPPLEKDGTSHLWDALGRHFMEMTYAEADKLSRKNKEFIRSLFPEGTIYASLLPKAAQDVIGKVGAQTRGVEKLLRRIGFRYAERVDPFDGGPHFTAHTDEITLVENSHRVKIEGLLTDETSDALTSGRRRAVVASETSAPPYFHAMLAPFEERSKGAGAIGESAAKALGIAPGDEAWILPLE